MTIAAMYGCPPPTTIAGRGAGVSVDERFKKILDELAKARAPVDTVLCRKEFQVAVESLRAQLREIEAKVDAPTKDLERQLGEEKRGRDETSMKLAQVLIDNKRLKRKVNRLLKTRPKPVTLKAVTTGVDGTEARVKAPKGVIYLGRDQDYGVWFDTRRGEMVILLPTEELSNRYWDSQSGMAPDQWRTSYPDSVALYDRWKAQQE